MCSGNCIVYEYTHCVNIPLEFNLANLSEYVTQDGRQTTYSQSRQVKIHDVLDMALTAGQYFTSTCPACAQRAEDKARQSISSEPEDYETDEG